MVNIHGTQLKVDGQLRDSKKCVDSQLNIALLKVAVASPTSKVVMLKLGVKG